MKDQRGFTLLEIMVAVAILAGLSVLTANAIRSGINNREKFNREIKQSSAVRDVLRVMERDINMAFHHRDIYTEMVNDIRKEQAKGTTPPPPPGQPPPPEQPGSAAELKSAPKNLTAFIGDAQSLHFTSLSNVRTYQDTPESEQAEVGYFVRSCRGRKPRQGRNAASSSNCLVRRLTANVDDDVSEGGNEIVLLEHVKDFKLRYFGPGRDEWVESWKTGKNGDALSKENFPLAVEISLSVHDTDDPKAKPFSMVMVAPIRFPNNPPKKDDAEIGAPQ